MTVVDIHTHHPHRRHAVIAVAPTQFAPQPGRLYAVGFHPWHITDSDDFDLLARLAAHPQVVAIGETGLDALRGPSLDVQIRHLERHIAIAQAAGLPIVVHMVRTSRPLIDVWRHSRAAVPLIVHGMRGNANVARMLLEAGCFLSYGEHFNPDAVRLTPLDRLLIETDDSPTSIITIARRVASARGLPAAELLRTAAATATRLVAGR